MPLENMKDMLAKAVAGKYAVGAFNILDYNSAKAVVKAAEEISAPVIIQTSAKTVVFWGSEALISWVRELADCPLEGKDWRPSASITGEGDIEHVAAGRKGAPARGVIVNQELAAIVEGHGVRSRIRVRQAGGSHLAPGVAPVL